MNRDLISRNIINIIDVKHWQRYQIFNGDHLEDELRNYLLKLTDPSNQDIIDAINELLNKNHQTIEKITHDQDISIQEKNDLMNALIIFKKKYMMHK